MSIEELDNKNSKVLILTIILSLLVCFAVILIWLNSISKRKTRAVEALTSVSAPVIDMKKEDLSIENAKVVAVPDVTEAEKPVPSFRSAEAITFRQYTVKEGDSVSKIAKEFNLRNQTIIQVNGLKTIYPSEGTALVIPSIDGQIYTVQKGDTFFSIIQKYSLSMSWNTLKAINNIESDVLTEGTTLFIPHSSVSFSENSVSSADTGSDDFIKPLRNGNISVEFAHTASDPLSGRSTEFDGILIQTLSAADVISSSSGSVVDRGFNSNGTSFVKVSHDNGYTTFYDYLTWVNVEVGQHVSGGETIGAISEGNTKLIAPALFFRIEQDGIALDPSYFF